MSWNEGCLARNWKSTLLAAREADSDMKEDEHSEAVVDKLRGEIGSVKGTSI